LLEAATVHIAAALSEDIIGRLDTASVIKCLDDAAWTATALTAEALALLERAPKHLPPTSLIDYSSPEQPDAAR
jgi:hypothetical protein